MAGINIIVKVYILRQQIAVRAVAAAGQDHRLRADGIARIGALGNHAADRSVLYNQLLGRRTRHQRAARRSELLAQILDNARAAALAGVIALRRFGAHIRHSRALIGNQPVERGADDAGEQLHRRAVIFLVTVGHHILHQLFGRILIAILLLPARTRGNRARARRSARAADHARLFQQDYGAALLRGGQRSRQARGARADNHDIRIQRFFL